MRRTITFITELVAGAGPAGIVRDPARHEIPPDLTVCAERQLLPRSDEYPIQSPARSQAAPVPASGGRL